MVIVESLAAVLEAVFKGPKTLDYLVFLGRICNAEGQIWAHSM